MTSRRDHRMHGGNRFKLGLFGLNCSGGLTMTKAAERWEASWENNLTAAKLSEDAGLEFILPVARWHGYRGETDSEGTSLETLTWATGCRPRHATSWRLAPSMCRSSIRSFAAKQCITADQIGQGRFGLNIVSGWNAGEFDMFGAQLLEHDERYVYSEEWATIVKRVWTEHEPFDFAGKYFNLKGVMIKPKPLARAVRCCSAPALRGPAGRLRPATPTACSWWWSTPRRCRRRSQPSANRPAGRLASMRAVMSYAAVPKRRRRTTIITSFTRWATGRPPIIWRISGAAGSRCPPSIATDERAADQRHRDVADDRRS